MIDTVECPYCGHVNDMSDGLVDLPSDNRFDHQCESCERDFEVHVEFEPNYSSGRIDYVDCEKCGKTTRDICKKGRIFPYPEHYTESEVCEPCFLKGMAEQFDREGTLERDSHV